MENHSKIRLFTDTAQANSSFNVAGPYRSFHRNGDDICADGVITQGYTGRGILPRQSLR